MSKIKANYIVNKIDSGPPELTRGAIVPPGATFNVNGGVNVSGVSTATAFVGDGSGITNTLAAPGKIVSFKRLFSYDETLST